MPRADSVDSDSDFTSSSDDDEVVEVHAQQRPRLRPQQNFQPGLLLPRPSLMDAVRAALPSDLELGRAEQRRATRTTQTTASANRGQPTLPSLFQQLSRSQAQAVPSNQTQPGQAAAVIDLTEEPDSPEEPRILPPPPGRNPRRSNSRRTSPPRLARSDGPWQVPMIDLTSDSPEEEDARQPGPASTLPRRFGHTGTFNARANDDLVGWDISNTIGSTLAHIVGREFSNSGFTRRLAGIFGVDTMGANPPHGNFRMPDLNVTRSAFAQPAPEPKPPMEDIAPARDGFTRDTCLEPEESAEKLIICPACEGELAYDPSDQVTQTGNTGKKRKRAPGEHHFWALKKCGHVYCADCFENRKPTKINPGVGFRGTGNDLRCVVDDCQTKVSQKGEWVGIFL